MLAPIRFLCAGIAKRFSTSVGLVASAAVTSPINTWYVLRRCGSRPNPTPLEAFDWGSQSTSSVRAPDDASEAARLMAVVVLPTPPFWLATAMTRTTFGRILGCKIRPRRNEGQCSAEAQSQFPEEKLCNFRIVSRKPLIRLRVAKITHCAYPGWNCSTWNNLPLGGSRSRVRRSNQWTSSELTDAGKSLKLFHVEQ